MLSLPALFARREAQSKDRGLYCWLPTTGLRRISTELDNSMPASRHFKESISARVQRHPGFRRALLRDGIENLLFGDLGTSKI
jgi:hypothetical protein